MRRNLLKIEKLYIELSPTERIPRIVSEYIYPHLKTLDFKLSNSGLSMKRTFGSLHQDIWVSLNRRNIGEEVCSFTPHFSSTIKQYPRWRKAEYGSEPLNDVLMGCSANSIWQGMPFAASIYTNYNMNQADAKVSPMSQIFCSDRSGTIKILSGGNVKNLYLKPQ